MRAFRDTGNGHLSATPVAALQLNNVLMGGVAALLGVYHSIGPISLSEFKCSLNPTHPQTHEKAKSASDVAKERGLGRCWDADLDEAKMARVGNASMRTMEWRKAHAAKKAAVAAKDIRDDDDIDEETANVIAGAEERRSLSTAVKMAMASDPSRSPPTHRVRTKLASFGFRPEGHNKGPWDNWR